MRKIKYPLIVSDFDGTLARRDGTVSEKTKRAIERYIQDGGTFAISTGRMPASIIPRAKALGLKGMICCGQGSVIIDLESGEPILQGSIPNALSVKICKKMEEMGLHTHAYELFRFYANMDDEPLKLYEAAVGEEAIRVLDKPLWKHIEETGMRSFKFLAMVKPEDAPAIIDELRAENFENCVVTKSAKFLVEVCNGTYSKGTSVEFLAKWCGTTMENTIAIGDQWNDLPMLERAGLGIAVANASEELKGVATVVPYTNNEDAVAYVIERYAYTTEE